MSAPRTYAAPASRPARRAPVALVFDPANFTPFYNLSLAAALAAAGWDVELVTSEYEFEDVTRSATCRVRLVSRVRLGRLTRRRPLRQVAKTLSYVIAMFRFDRRLARLAPSIVHVQWALLPWLDRAFWSRWRRSGWKVVYTAHDVPPLPGTTPRLFARSYPGLIRGADAVVVHSEYARTAVLEMGGASERVHVVPPASPVSPSAFGSSRTDARRELGIPLDDPIVLFFGFVKPYKGLSVLLESLPALRREVPEARLLIVGEVMESSPSYERLTAELGICSAVDWRPGFVPSERLGAYFAAADVVALPYLQASSSGVLLTAYSCPRPVVATAVGGLGELVVPGVTGLVVPPADPVALADALAELLRDPARAERMAERGLELAETRYTWPGVARRLDALYCDLLV